MTNAEDVAANLSTVEGTDSGVVALEMKGGANGDSAKGMFFIFNRNNEEKKISLPEGSWDVYINGEKAGTEVIETLSGTATAAPISAMVLVKSDEDAPVTQPEASNNSSKALIVIVIVVAVLAIAGGVIVIRKRKKIS